MDNNFKNNKKRHLWSIQSIAVVVAMAAIVFCSSAAIMNHNDLVTTSSRLEKILEERNELKSKLESSDAEIESLRKQQKSKPAAGKEEKNLRTAQLLCGNPGTIARRFNNPCNVKRTVDGSKWKGQLGYDREGHIHFKTVFHGIRATAITLRSYAKKHKIKTIQALIDRYCGGNPGYVKFLCEELHLKPDQKFNIMSVLPELVWLMSQYESGRRIPNEWVVTLDLARE